MKKYQFIALFAALAITVAACTPQQQQEVADTMMEDDEAMMEDDSMGHDDSMMEDDKMKDDSMMEGDKMMFEYQGSLEDVSGGTASGVAQAIFKDGTYTLKANFKDLPDPTGTDFYEGWVVRKNPLSVISTGRVDKVNGQYENNFTDSRDLTDHASYILTIEPDDGDPAPADHVLDGVLTKN